jgi:hypothetical protein
MDPDASMDIDGEPQRSSNIFQVSLFDQDIQGYRRIQSQPLFNPLNCGASSANLLGIITPDKADQMTSDLEGINTLEWQNYLNSLAPDTVTYSFNKVILTEQVLKEFSDNIFPQFGTFILIQPSSKDHGHYCVLAKDKNYNIVIFDPQDQKCLTGLVNIENFIKNLEQLHRSSITMYFILMNQPRTISQLIKDSEFIKSRKSGGSSRDRLPSLPTRRVRNFSSSKKRRYSHRRRALQTGKVGYRPTKTGRKV